MRQLHPAIVTLHISPSLKCPVTKRQHLFHTPAILFPSTIAFLSSSPFFLIVEGESYSTILLLCI